MRVALILFLAMGRLRIENSKETEIKIEKGIRVFRIMVIIHDRIEINLTLHDIENN